MLWNNIKIALRNLRKNKVFAAINVLGLALGLTIYLLGGLIHDYEKSHDLFFAKSDRIYTIGSIAAPATELPFGEFDAVYPAVGPILKAELTDLEAVARTISREFLLTLGSESFYESLLFADPEILNIFDFDYLHGDATALQDPSGLLITEATAIRYFGRTDVLGEVVTFDNEFDYYVAAVIESPPLNSHFNSSMVIDKQLGFIAPLMALNKMRDWDMAGNWSNLSLGNMTYVLLPESLDASWLKNQVNSVYERLTPEGLREEISEFSVNHISNANTALWDMVGLPVIEAIALLSFLVLVVACVNYTNLATAQSLGRTREVGMRKTMGATQRQLLMQFLVESLVIASIAMIIALATLELLIPLINNASNKALSLNYASTLPWVLGTTLLVGLFAGLYPAWLITKTNPIEALRDIARKGRKGNLMRSFMIGVQFAISAFMLAIVSIVFIQNEVVKQSSYEFPRSEIYTLDRLNIDDIRGSLDTLQRELEAIPNVERVTYSWQVPYEQNNSQRTFTPKPGDEASEFSLMVLHMSPEFLDVYDIDLLAGRNLSRDIANDERRDDSTTLNVLINELALPLLGAETAEEAINKRFYTLDADASIRDYVVVGVAPTQNIVGLFNKEKPWFYQYDPSSFRIASVRIDGGNMMETVGEIENTWDRVIPDYPMQGRFLDEVFDEIYNILKFMNIALAGFAFVALALAMIGLFGLAAFMAAQRTKEIGVRKVLGASSTQIARLLVWQFSQPVMWALLFALPLAFVASNLYLNFFADRFSLQIPVLLVAGLVAVLLAWSTIAGHAIRIARANPVLALRYE